MVHLQYSDLSDSDWEKAEIYCVHGHQTRFNGAEFHRTVFTQCDFVDSGFSKAKMTLAHFHFCTLHKCTFRWAQMDGTTLEKTSLRGSRIHLACLNRLIMSEVDLAGIKGLFGPNRAFTRVDRNFRIEDHYTESARFHRPWKIRKGLAGLYDRSIDRLERHAASWERLRTIGQLRLFGVSYLAVVVIASYTLLAKWHNTRVVATAHQAAERAEAAGETDLWATFMRLLPELPTPAHLGWQLLMTGLLATAATIYAMFCPNEVREATEVGWTRRMGQPLWEYRSAKWSRAWARYPCLILFLIGGLYTLGYLLVRSYSAIVYLFRGIFLG